MRQKIYIWLMDKLLAYNRIVRRCREAYYDMKADAFRRRMRKMDRVIFLKH